MNWKKFEGKQVDKFTENIQVHKFAENVKVNQSTELCYLQG